LGRTRGYLMQHLFDHAIAHRAPADEFLPL
jgi:hypothetical protein